MFGIHCAKAYGTQDYYCKRIIYLFYLNIDIANELLNKLFIIKFTYVYIFIK